MSTRSKVALELSIIAVLTMVFLLLFPRRQPIVDLGLAGLALACLGLSAGYTKRVIWAVSPPAVMENRFRRSVIVTLWVTVPTVLLFLVIGGILGYKHAGWDGVVSRVCNVRILAALGFYLPWALMQQTLFQFYLLGRLLVLFPKGQAIPPVVITGLCFSLVHLPDVWTTLVTALAGVVWTIIYYRYRCLLPLAFSHAALGSAFYYGIFGHDLSSEWRAILP